MNCAHSGSMIVAVRFDSIETLAKTMNKPVHDVNKRISQDTGVTIPSKSYNAAKKLKELKNAPLNYENFPSKVPQVILYRAIVSRFGLFINKGEAVYELKGILDNRKFEADIALPRYRVAIEMDGWESHGKSLAGFKRDREKWLLFATEGWLVLPISREQIDKRLDDVIDMISQCVDKRERIEADIQLKNNVVGAKYIKVRNKYE